MTKNRVVIRLSRSWYKTERGVAHRIEIRYVHKFCKGFNMFMEDIDNAGAQVAIESITNLGKCKDGLYVVVFNPYRDLESGIVDDWDYTLVPFAKEEEK